MSKREAILKELQELYAEGHKLAEEFEQNVDEQFEYDYQYWYTKAIKAVHSLAPDRHEEFCRYYQIDPKRKEFGYGTYVIQDYIKGVAPNRTRYPNFNSRKWVANCFFNQLSILNALAGRVNSILSNIESEIYSEIQDNEVAIAKQLAKVNLRAAGALIGVVVEGHLQKIALRHEIKIAKKNPTIADLSEPLKAAGVLDTPAWRKVTYLADLRNICAHKKDVEPSKEQVEELIHGAEWLTKNIF